MPTTDKTIILIGLEGPELVNQSTGRVDWKPVATDPHFRSLVKRAIVEFMLKNSQDEWQWNVSSADVAVFRNGEEFLRPLGRDKYTRAIVYAHGDGWALMPTISNSTTHVRDYTLAKGFGQSGVRQALILGCNSKHLAETVARVLEKYTRVGGIDHIRDDEVDARHTRLNILNMIIWGYGGDQQ